MSLLEFPIRRYQVTLVALLCLTALGWFAFRSVPREEDPYFRIAGAQITAVYPGADPQDLEQLVVKPIEDRLAELDDVYKIDTTISDGLAFTYIEFNAGADADGKFDEVTREVNALRPTLPPEAQQIELRKVSPGLVNIVQVALVAADTPYPQLQEQARQLKDVLKTVPGIRTAESWAYPQRELRVELDLPRMAELGVKPPQVLQALTSENANLSGGSVDVGSRNFSLKTFGGYRALDQVRDTVVQASGARLVQVRDIAKVSWSTQQWSYVGRFNGQRAVFVTANQKDGYNILEVSAAVDAALQRFAHDLPGGVRLERGFDQSRNVAARLDHLYLDLGIAIGLVLLTLLPLGLRAAGIVMVAIPLSFAFGLATLYFMGYSLNQISIAAFVVALGLLVDDSIVVTENIARHLRQGATRTAAALAGTRQIAVAILGCTAALAFAFLPLMALPGNSGKFIRVLPLTVVATIVGSLLVALFIIPFIASRVLGEHEHPQGSVLLQRVMGAIHRYYRPALHYCLARPRATALAAIGGALLLSALLVPVIGSSLFPKAETPQFLITVETPDGSSLAATDAALRFVEQRLKRLPQVRSWFANLGHGNPRIYYNIIPRGDAANYAEVFVQLDGYDTRRTPRTLDGLRAEFARYPGAHIYVKEFVNGPPVTAPLSVRVSGPGLADLQQLASRVERVIQGTPGTRDVDNPLRVARTNLKLAVDPQKAALLGVPMVDFERAVRLSVAGIPAGTFKDPSGEQYDIMVRSPVGPRADIDSLEQVRVPTATGALLPVSQLAHLQLQPAPTQIQRYNRERTVTINADIERGYNTAKVTAAVARRLDAVPWPRGYRYVLGGEAESSAEAFGGIGTAIIIAVFGIFAILVLEFGSFRSTLIVLTVVPLGVLGGLLMLLLSGNSISFTASIGFIALIGIEIKNSILFVDFTNQLREQGLPIGEAIEQAGETRFLPILLTSATAIGGLLPLALQNAGLYSPMAWVIIGGLISSTLLARLVTPVMYRLIPPAIPAGS
ncbi:MAG: efflux RND transporter permease subunit [Proteobacteria bacterium]|nr:efflux RND transporter permease subunit [Pseudomonadota bacterium]